MIRNLFTCTLGLFLCCTTLVAQESYVGNFIISGNMLPVTKTLHLNDPGYLVAEIDSVSGVNGIQVRFTDTVTGRVDINQSRLDFPGDVVLNIHQRNNAAYSGQVRLKIKFYPINDVLEPNDKAEQAAGINPFIWYNVNMFPYSDLDHFAVTLDKPGWINPVNQNGPIQLRWDLLDENGAAITNRFPYFANAGKYVLKLSPARNESTLEPVVFRVNLLPETDQLEPNDTAAVEIETDKIYSVNLSSPADIDNFFINTDKSGYLVLKTLQAPVQSVQFSYNLQGKQFRGNPLVIPVNETGKVEVKMTAGNSYFNNPFFIVAEKNSVLDPAEPNDSMPAAITVNKSKGVYFSVFPYGDEDWYHIKTTGPGRIILNIFDAVSTNKNIYNSCFIELYDTAKKSIGIGKRNTEYGIICASEYLRQGGDWYLRITGNNNTTTEQLLGMRIYGPNVSGNAQSGDDFDDIYFIGFELDTSANAMLTALSESVGSELYMVDSTRSLEETLGEVFKDAKRRKRAWLWWVAGILVAGGGAGYWWYRKKKSEA